MPIYVSDSDSDDYDPSASSSKKLHGQKPTYSIFQRGKVADVLLWKNKKLSAGILMGFTVIWFLFEVAEYTFVSLVCHILMFFMLAFFLWSSFAGLIKWNPPTIDDIRLPESTFRVFFSEINHLLITLYDISTGNDRKTFLLTIACLWILSAFGSLCNTLTLLYIVFLCLATLPALYNRYEDQVDYFAGRSGQDMKDLFYKFNSQVLDKIPRKPKKPRKPE